MRDKHDLTKLEQLKSPKSLEDRVLAMAKQKAAKQSFLNKKSVPALALSYCLGLATLWSLNNINQEKIKAPIIVLEPLTFRGSDESKAKKIDTSKLSEQELKELSIELIIRGEAEQAKQLIIWHEHKYKTKKGN